MVDSIKLTANDRALMTGVNALSRYGASLDRLKREFRKVKKDIDSPENAIALLKIKQEIDTTLTALADWEKAKSELPSE